MIRAVCANLGCASPSAVSADRRAAAFSWAEGVRRANRADLVFAQEIPGEEWLEPWRKAGYDAADLGRPSYGVKSALLWRDIDDEGALCLPSGGYHGSYVTGRLLRLPGLDEPTAVVSYHASPMYPTDLAPHLATWRELGLALPAARLGGGRHSGMLFDADMVVVTLKLVAASHPVLAAGDLNEALRWDTVHGERWGQLLHRRAAEGPRPLEFTLHRLWEGERATHIRAGDSGYQLDHVLATHDVGRLVNPDAVVDQTWSQERIDLGHQSDHAPIWFTVGE